MIGSLYAVVLDCPDPALLAEFYRSFLGGRIEQDGEWVDLILPGNGARLSFQHSPGFVPPRWPGDDGDQQSHLDISVGDIEEAHDRIVDCGARFIEAHEGFRVYLDPAGHPFCTVR